MRESRDMLSRVEKRVLDHLVHWLPKLARKHGKQIELKRMREKATKGKECWYRDAMLVNEMATWPGPR
jgi:hypothetical protein